MSWQVYKNQGIRERVLEAIGLGTKSLKPVHLTKDIDGRTRATIVFSNNFEDRHSQIIPEVVQDRYVEWANRTGILPEFQVGSQGIHLGSKSRWGQADLVMRNGHFTVASGLVDPGMEFVAETFANNPDTGVSNGYWGLTTKDKREFLEWYPFEVSVFPSVRETANVWMGENIEGEFMFNEDHKAYLKTKGVPDAMILALEAATDARGEAVAAGGVGSKGEPAPTTVVVGGPVVSPPPPTGELPGGLEAFAAVLDQKLTPLVGRLDALEIGHKSLADKVGQTREEVVASELEAKIIAGGPGYKASESQTNQQIPAGVPAGPDLNWLGKELDGLLKSGTGAN